MIPWKDLPSEGAQYWAAHEAEEAAARWVRTTRRRLTRDHGDEGLALIAKLVGRAQMAHPGMTEQAAWEWAEDLYLRGDVLC